MNIGHEYFHFRKMQRLTKELTVNNFRNLNGPLPFNKGIFVIKVNQNTYYFEPAAEASAMTSWCSCSCYCLSSLS